MKQKLKLKQKKKQKLLLRQTGEGGLFRKPVGIGTCPRKWEAKIVPRFKKTSVRKIRPVFPLLMLVATSLNLWHG